jgi:hypothetical protein
VAASLVAAFKAAKTVEELFNIIDSGQVALSLGDVEMSAAKASFEAVPHALDKRGQVWECIGHLTSAQHAYEKYILSRMTGNVTLTRTWRDDDTNVKRRFALIVKAVCYGYLGEQRLCQGALQLANKPVEKEKSKIEYYGLLGYLAGSAITGSILAEFAYTFANDIGFAEHSYGIDGETFTNLSSLLGA